MLKLTVPLDKKFKESFWGRVLVCFFPTLYLDSKKDLQEWEENHRRNYITFLRVCLVGASIVLLLLYFLVDSRPTMREHAVYFTFFRFSVILLCFALLYYTYTEHYQKNRYYKLPVYAVALVYTVLQTYMIFFLDSEIPLLYLFLGPLLFVWIFQLSPGASTIIATLGLGLISVLVMAIFPYNNFYFNNIVSLLSVAVFMSFLMRMVMLHEVKFFVVNKRFLEETKLRYKELGDLAAQVAHDIRSPLSAIMILAKDNPNIPEDSRVLFRTGVTRILDITNELLNKARGFLDSTKQEHVVDVVEKNSVHLITNILESIVSEKRVEFRAKLNVQIQTNFNSSSFGMFANIQKSELKRILSNLINNSVEAVKEKGRIEINATLVSDTVIISVQDNGIGIPAEILPKLLKRGATFNKGEKNLGVGLYHAHTKVTGWGGNVTITSELNRGTKVTLTLPACVPPKWFAEKIEVSSYSKVVILDDDLAIHQVWDKRFANIIEEETGIELVHLSTVGQFELWSKENTSSDVLYLVDYELLGQTKNGVDVIKSYGLQDCAILVTSRSEEQPLIDRCLNLGIKILPKISADIVPIVVAGQGIIYKHETHISEFDPKMVN